MKDGMTHWERFRAVMAGRPADRLPRVEWAQWWNETIDRWRQEGLPVKDNDLWALSKYWGLDYYHKLRLCPLQGGPQPAHHGAGVLEDIDGYTAHLQYLYADAAEDDLADWATWQRRQDQNEALVWCEIDGFFWFPRTLLGIENHLYAFYDQPDLIHRINRDATNYYLRALERMADVARPAYVHVLEDMSYNNGPMLSRELFDQFLAPYYRRLIPAIKDMLGSLVFVDSDGRVEEMVPWLRDVGVDGVLPLERHAGVDGMSMRRAHPELGMIGHFDKMTMPLGENAMRGEFERLRPLIRSGRFIPSVDHQTPPGVSMADYRVYRRLLDEYTGASFASPVGAV
jgi:hypothetical protein